MNKTTPRVGILDLAPTSFYDPVREAGGRPVRLESPGASPRGGVALEREWVADWFETFCSVGRLDGLLISLRRSGEELAGLLLAALRLDLPTVIAPRCERPFDIVPFALGFAPFSGHPASLAVEVARDGGPRARDLAESFPLANALRAGIAAGGGPELLVHLSALAREADAVGFDQMIRVLAPESAIIAHPDSDWFREHGAGGLLAHLGGALHDVTTVEGTLKESLPIAPPAPPESGGSRIVFVRGRASGTEAVCVVAGAVTEAAGECRVFDSEEDAVRAVDRGGIEAGSLVVVRGCGPRGGPGLLRLERLRDALDKAGLTESVTVLTDGVAPENARGVWASLFTPEAAVGGIIGRLRDGDTLRLDFEEGAIRTGVKAEVMESRESRGASTPGGYGYAARYSRSALPALEGAGFG